MKPDNDHPFAKAVRIYECPLRTIDPKSAQPFFCTQVTERIGQVVEQHEHAHATAVVWENGAQARVRADLKVLRLSTKIGDVRSE
jgi:hypothetical protein